MVRQDDCMGHKQKRHEPPINKREVRQRLDRALSAGNLIRVRRWVPDSELVEGFVVARGKAWVTLAKLSDSINLDGWVSLRAADIQSVTVIPTEDCFEIKVLQAREQWPPAAPTSLVDTTVEELLRSLGEGSPLVTVYREFERPDTCWIGSATRIDDGTLALLEVNVAGGWARRPRLFDLADVTRIESGGGYEEALALVAGPAPRPTSSRRSS